MDGVRTEPEAETPRWRSQDTLVRLLLVLFVGALFLRTIRYGLYLDDQHHARAWAWRQVIGTFHGPFDPLGIEPPYFRPLVVVTFAVDWRLWGNWEVGYHLTNLAWHAAATVVVHALLRRTRVASAAAFAGAALFAAIPANAATAVYISERSDAMVVVFVGGALLCSSRYWRTGSRIALAGAVGLFALAVGSKEIGIAGILLVPLWWWYARTSETTAEHVPGRSRAASVIGREVVTPFRRDGRRRLLVTLVSFGSVAALYVVARSVALRGEVGGEAYGAEGPVIGLASAVYRTAAGAPWEVRAVPFPFLVALVTVAFVARRADAAWRVVALGAGWIVLACLPLARLGRVEPRLLYLPEVGVAFVAAGTVTVLLRAIGSHVARRRFAVAVAAAVLGFGFVATTTKATLDAQDQFAPGSPKKLLADLGIWVKPTRDRWPHDQLVRIERRLRDAGLIDGDGNEVTAASAALATSG